MNLNIGLVYLVRGKIGIILILSLLVGLNVL